MTLTDADLDRIEAVLRDDHAKGYSYANLLLDDAQPLVAEVRRLRAAQITTLVACSRCGHGQRARHMVALGDERLCVECAGVEMGRLRELVTDAVPWARFKLWRVENYGDGYDQDITDITEWLTHAAADAPRAGEGE